MAECIDPVGFIAVDLIPQTWRLAMLNCANRNDRAIVANAGYDDRDILAELNLAGPGHVFDDNSGQAIEVDTAGIYDAATTQKSAVYAAIAGAGLALTIDVLVHRNGDEPAPVPNQSPGKRKQL